MTNVSLTILFVACIWFFVSHIVLAARCFLLSKGSAIPRFQLLIANPIFMYRFIFRMGNLARVRGLVASELVSFAVILLGIPFFLLS